MKILRGIPHLILAFTSVLLGIIALLSVLSFPKSAEAAVFTDLTEPCQNLRQCEESEMPAMLEILSDQGSGLSAKQFNFLKSEYRELGGDAQDVRNLDYANPTNSCGLLNMSACIEELWNTSVTFLGYIPASIGAAVLTLVGSLFNFLLDNTIIQFQTSIIDKIDTGINTAWTAFRDIANIVIIGMFTFIAISLILGIKEYGERKMIARVLIVAVLINFSLLFTKVIIDASNFTAYQFYKAASLQAGAVENVSVGDVSASSGIAGAFLKSMGVTSIGDLYGSLKEFQEGAQGSFWRTIFFGFLTGALFFLAAAVLLYGSFLLLARALLLIFLMITAPLAFASWLIPKFSQQGWHTWWDSLLRAAVFAPLLMILLWVSLQIAFAFQAREGATLGSLVSNPAGGLGMQALFSYLIILGVLFMSIKLASKFSGTIAGFGAAAGLTLTPLAGVSRLGGLAGRKFIGGSAGYLARKVQDKGWNTTKTGRALWRPLAGTAKRSFDIMSTKGAQKAVSGLGGVTFGKEVGKGGYWGVQERKAAKLERGGRARAPSGEAREKRADETAQKVGKEIEKEIKGAAAQAETAKKKQQEAQPRAEQERADAEHQYARSKGTSRDEIETAYERTREHVANSERELGELQRQFAQNIARAASGGNAKGAAQLRQAQDVQIEEIKKRINTEKAARNQQQQTLNEMRQFGLETKKALTEPLDAEVKQLEKQRESLEKGKRERVEKARQERNWKLQGTAIANAMADSLAYLGRRSELKRQIGGAVEKQNLRKAVAAMGAKLPEEETEKEPTTPPIPPSPQAPQT